jgi:DNA primase
MARIPDHELAELKRTADLLSLVRDTGVELKRHGKDWLGLCPAHEDRQASLIVSPDRDPPLWRCAGACDRGGSAIDWLMVMDARRLPFLEAVEELQRRQGVAGSNGNGHRLASASATTAMPATSPGPVVPEPERAALLEEVVAHYEAALPGSAGAAYAASRGISDEAMERFRLGWPDRTLGLSLREEGEAGEAKREGLKALGVLRAETGHEFLRGCLVIPVLAAGGTVLNLYGRRVRQHVTVKHFYLPGPRRGVFNPAGLGSGELILCESLIDALTFWSHGFRQVTCSWGVHGFTEDHRSAIREAGIERLLIAYDNDKAGNDAAGELGRRLGEEGIACFRVRFPRGLDANAFALKVTPAREALGLALRSAEHLSGPERPPTVGTARSLARETGPGPAESANRAPESAVSEASEAEPAPEGAAAPPAPPATSAVSAEEPPPRRPGITLAALDARRPLDFSFGARRWRVRGVERNLSHAKLQVLLRLAVAEAFFVDTVDLAQAKQRAAFLHAAAAELELEEAVVKKDLRKIHRELEELQDRLIERELSPQESTAPAMPPEAERSALEYLRQPDLLGSIRSTFHRCGVVGEEVNTLLGYLAATSRLLEQPLAVIIQSSSAAGKSSLMDAILELMPEEERVQYSAMTGQSLFYMGETNLSHKILAIVEEEGAERASYALKLLQSEGELTIASTGKDPQTGKLVTHEYHVSGPVSILLTTTAIEIDEELLNRCLVLTVDESREQTRAIHRRQRERRTLEGLLARRERDRLVELHRNAQRLLKPLPVVNPYAPRLTFLDSQTRARRDHEKYLTLIDAIALLHQYQRPKKQARDRAGKLVEYLEVELSDIEVANRLAGEVLGRSLDELPPQTRRFLEDLYRMVSTDCERLAMERCDYRFSRRQACEELGWSLTQARLHLDRLLAHEYLAIHRGGRGLSFVYELLYDGSGRDGRRFLVELIDTESLGAGEYELDLAGSEAGVADSKPDLAGSKRADGGPMAGRKRGVSRRVKASEENGLEESGADQAPASTTGGGGNDD